MQGVDQTEEKEMEADNHHIGQREKSMRPRKRYLQNMTVSTSRVSGKSFTVDLSI